MPIGWEDEKVTIDPKKYLGEIKKPSEVVGSGRSSGEDLNISATDWRDWLRNYISPVGRGFLRMGGETLGAGAGTLAAPFTGPNAPIAPLEGAVTGGIAADQLWQNTLGRLNPRIFGGPNPDLGASLKTSALETGADLAFVRGLPIVKNALSSAAIKHFFKPNPNVPIREALRSLPEDFKPTIGQATQKKFPQWLENTILTEGERDARQFTQQNVMRRLADDLSLSITGARRGVIPTRQELGTLANESATQQYKQVHAVRKSFYDKSDALISNETTQGFRVEPSRLVNPKTGKPLGSTLVPTTIVGPVNPTRTIDFAKNTVLKEIDALLADPNNANYRIPEVRSTMDALRNKVMSFAKGELADANGQPVMNYATAKADKDELNALYHKIPYDAQTRLAETIKTMRNLVGQDIAESSQNWSAPAREALEKANAYHRDTFKKLFGPTIAKKLAEVGKFTDNPDIIEENLLELGMKNATIAGEIVNASGKLPLASEYTKRFFESLTDVNGQMMGTGGLNFVEQMKEIAPKFLTADQRAAINQFARNAQIATIGTGQPPITSMAFRAGYMALSIGSGVLAGNLSGNAATGLVAAGAIPKLRSELSKMLLNPANARLAARLPRLKAGSPEATSIMRKLFRTSLRGARFDVQDAVGQSLGLFEAQSDGKLHRVGEPVDISKPIKVGGTSSIQWE